MTEILNLVNEHQIITGLSMAGIIPLCWVAGQAIADWCVK